MFGLASRARPDSLPERRRRESSDDDFGARSGDRREFRIGKLVGDASVINDAIERFVRAWNRNNAVTLKEMLTPSATLAVSGHHQGATSGEGKSYSNLAG